MREPGTTGPGEAALPVRRTLAGRHLLLTGASGFLGQVWLSLLLCEVPDVQLTVLLRCSGRRSAEERLQHMLLHSPALRPWRALHGAETLRAAARRVRVLQGDCAAPRCGLPQAEAAARMANVDLVVHFAGSTDFMPDPREALSANVRGALHAAELASLAPGRRLLHVSTAFVAGRRDGRIAERLLEGRGPSGASLEPWRELDAFVRAAHLQGPPSQRTEAAMARAERLGWPNLYTYSKGLAEQLLASEPGLRLCVARPSIVECAWRFPFPGWNQGLNTSAPLVALFCTPFRHFPSRPHNHFDVVPVDVVARAMALLAAAHLRDEAPAVAHVASSDRNPLTFERGIELTNLSVRRMLRSTERSALSRWLLSRLDVVPVDAAARPLGHPADVARLAGRARRWLQSLDLREDLPPSVRRRWGERLEAERSRAARALRRAERDLSRIDQMLRQYLPFIHDHDLVFETRALPALSARLAPEEREPFGFDIESLDWRHYWLRVQGPGLERWSLPLVRGESVPEDPAPEAVHEASLAAEPPAEPLAASGTGLGAAAAHAEE